jgi:hypothetical protein
VEKQDCPDNVSQFLEALSAASHRFGIAISDSTLFVMTQEDYARTYRADDESLMAFD